MLFILKLEMNKEKAAAAAAAAIKKQQQGTYKDDLHSKNGNMIRNRKQTNMNVTFLELD